MCAEICGCSVAMLYSVSVPMDLDVKMKAVMLGACFLIVSVGLYCMNG